MDIFFDESGQTGTHLFDSAQPYFTLGSTNVEVAEAVDILARCFPRQQGPELKSQRLLRRSQGQRGFLEFAKEVGKAPERFLTAKYHKRFAVVTKMVDNLVEPLLRSQGYDFYAGGYAIRFANSAYFVFAHLLHKEMADTLMGLYNAFARDPNDATLLPLRTALQAADRDEPDGSEVTLGLMTDGADRIAALQNFSAIQDSNDIHVTGVVHCMAHWQAMSPGPFRVVHDESVHFFKRSGRWELMTNPATEPQVFVTGANTLTLPIPVTETVSARSHECASLQLCDLIAGFVSRVANAGESGEDSDFFRRAIDAGMGQMSVFPLAAGGEFAAGPPERANGPDVIDRIALAVAPKT